MSISLPLRNTAERYGIMAMALHWLIAAAFLANYAILYYREWFAVPRSELARGLLSYHAAIGVSVFVFVTLRIVRKCMSRQPDDVPGAVWEHRAARAVHWLLYAVMLIMPLSGYLGTGRASYLFFFIEIPPFSETWVFRTVVQGAMGLSWKQFEAPMDVIHKQGGASIVCVLIAAHAGAALFHHFIRKDGAFKRMLPLR